MRREKTGYYISHKNPLLWLSVAMVLSSAAVRAVYAAGQTLGRLDWTLQILLPVFTCLLLALTLLCSSRSRFHQTAYSVIFGSVFFALVLASGHPWYWKILWWCICLCCAAIYLLTVAAVLPTRWLLPFLFGVPIAVRVVMLAKLEHQLPSMHEVSCLLQLGGMLLCTLAMRRHPNDGSYHAGWGDRLDGRRVRTLEALSQASPLFMVERNEAFNLYADAIEITETERFIREKRKNGMPNLGLMHIMLASYVRMISQFPALNRFVSGQNIYARKDIEISMTIKKEMTKEAPESMIDVFFEPTDTLEDVYRKMDEAVQEIKNTPLNSSFDKTATLFGMVPKTICKFIVWLIKTADFFGLLPLWLLHISPFHGSLFITSMGSLGIKPIYHHLYNFGNMPVFISFGAKRRENEVKSDGSVVSHKYFDFTVVMDERICDGFYYAESFKFLRRCMMHPEQLEVPPAVVKQDIP